MDNKNHVARSLVALETMSNRYSTIYEVNRTISRFNRINRQIRKRTASFNQKIE